MSDGMPQFVIEDLFRERGLIFVDDEAIPAAMKAGGWSAALYQKATDDGYAVVHCVFGPDAVGEPVCVHAQKMAVQVLEKLDHDGRSSHHIAQVEVFPAEGLPGLQHLLESMPSPRK